MRHYLALLLAALAPFAAAQLGPVLDCITRPCVAVSDPFPSTGPQPAVCAALADGVEIAAAPVVGPPGAVSCRVEFNLARGGHDVTLVARAPGHDDSAPSNAVTVGSFHVAAPINVRFRLAAAGRLNNRRA